MMPVYTSPLLIDARADETPVITGLASIQRQIDPWDVVELNLVLEWRETR